MLTNRTISITLDFYKAVIVIRITVRASLNREICSLIRGSTTSEPFHSFQGEFRASECFIHFFINISKLFSLNQKTFSRRTAGPWVEDHWLLSRVMRVGGGEPGQLSLV